MITARALNRATLARQLLLRREPVGVVEAAGRVVALQAQQPASPYLALWNRVAGLDAADLDAAFAGQRLLKATLMRFTLHVVHPDDYPVLHAALQPTLRSRLTETRFTGTGLSAEDAVDAVEDLLCYLGEQRTNAEVEQWLRARFGVPPKEVWRALRPFPPLLHAPTGAPWSFGERPSYIRGATAPAPYSIAAADEALQVLVRRYLEGFGPATVADVAQFAMVQRSRVRAALRAMDGALERLVGPEGAELLDVPGAPRPDEGTRAPPRLMAMWDSVLLAHADRSRVLPPEYRRVVIRANGDVLPTVLVDGTVAGVWRPAEGGIEVTVFHHLRDEDWDGLAVEAEALTAFLADREPDVYRRYARWWATLPSAERRVLPAR